MYCAFSFSLFTYRSEQSGKLDGQVPSTTDCIHQPATARTGKSIPHEQVSFSTKTIRSGNQLVLV